jgi:hypothetical protein
MKLALKEWENLSHISSKKKKIANPNSTEISR